MIEVDPLPPRLERALLEISNALLKADAKWVLVGSTASYLNGLNLEPRDIDIIIEADKVYKVDEIFASEFQPIRRVRYSSSGVYSSHYGVFKVHNVEVEVMADLTICGDHGCLKVGFEDLYSHSKNVRVGEAIVKVAPLEWQLVANIMIPGKMERVKLILNVLKIRGVNIEVLSHVLKHAPANAKKRTIELIQSYKQIREELLM